MKTSCFLILSLLLLSFSGGGLARAAEKDWDRILDKYEALCESCLELRVRAEAGEKVSKASLGRLYSTLLDLRSQLRSGTGTMSEAQRKRFERLKMTYALLFGFEDAREEPVKETQPRPSSSPAKAPPSVRPSKVEPVVPQAGPGPDSATVVRTSFPELPPMEDIRSVPVMQVHPLMGLAAPEYSNTEPVLEMPSRGPHLSWSVVASISPWPEISFGGAVSIFANNCGWGGYARFRSNFASSSWSYLSYSDGSCEGGAFWPSGGRGLSVLHSSAGVRRNFGSRFAFMAGAGYGRKTVLWEDIDHNWSKVKDLSVSGLALECGPAAGFGPVEFQLLVSTINFRTASLEFAFGFRF